MSWIKIHSDEYIISEYNSGRHAADISKELGVSNSTILRHLHANKINIRRPVLSVESRKKLSEHKKGKHWSEESKLRFSKSGNHLYGKKNNRSPAWRELPDKQISDEYLAGSSIDSLSIRYKCSFETISRHLKNFGITLRSHSESIRGSKNGRWNNGASFEPYCLKFNESLKEHIRESFNRKCVICGLKEIDNGEKLSVHHINFDKKSGCYGRKWNLVPLCHICHTKTTNHRFEYFNLLMNMWATNEEINLGAFTWDM